MAKGEFTVCSRLAAVSAGLDGPVRAPLIPLITRVPFPAFHQVKARPLLL